MYDTTLGIRCVGMGKCQSEDSFFCFGAKPTQRACMRDFLRGRKNTVRESTEVNRRDQGREQDSWQKSGEADSQEKKAEQGSRHERAGDC